MTPTTDQLKDLLAKVTPGEWHWVDPDNDEPWNGESYMVNGALRTVHKHQTGFSYTLPDFIIDHAEEIGADRSAAHTLIALAPTLAAEVVRLRQALIEIMNTPDVDADTCCAIARQALDTTSAN